MAMQLSNVPRRWWSVSALAGLLGGVIMGIYQMVAYAVVGKDTWLPFNTLGTLLPSYRPPAVGFQTGPSLSGLVMHLVISVVWGLVFGGAIAAFFPQDARVWKDSVLLGIGGGTMVWAVMSLLLGSMLASTLYYVPPFYGYLPNLVYGLVTTLTLCGFERRKHVMVTFFPEAAVSEREASRWI
jgi:hypothetical protein